MTVAPALHDSERGTLIDVEVTPNASQSIFPAGYNPWRRRVEARVEAPPEDGRANRALLELVAQFFQVESARVAIVSGLQSRQKRLLLAGLSRKEVLERLSHAG